VHFEAAQQAHATRRGRPQHPPQRHRHRHIHSHPTRPEGQPVAAAQQLRHVRRHQDLEQEQEQEG